METLLKSLGLEPGPLTLVDSLSHQVFLGSDVVLKIIDAGRHTRLDREIALAPDLPAGVTAPLLSSGVHTLDGREVRYACYTRMPGIAPGMGLPGIGARTACSLAEQAIHRLGALHAWTPPDRAAQILREPLGHGGFVSRDALFRLLDGLAAADRHGVVPSALLTGITAIAANAPDRARTVVPVHADCHWGNWLATGDRLTTLLDFEWARFGEPLDDWFFVISLSGPHQDAVLDVVARETATSPGDLRAACEVRHATYLASDILLALTTPDDVPAGLLTDRLTGLEELIRDRPWR
ncbi:phosphotransferase [Actinoplanes sp. NPDC023801]|uniref:phosphotransferase family protein n=1 Tax=Actinoplanes sp. NPDC023801 TaxID=3154595 RepID=UPI003400EE6A